MALSHSPKIPLQGLLFLYDEQNIKSGNTSELILGRNATVQSTTERRFTIDSSLSTIHASSINAYNSTAPLPGTGFSFSVWLRRTGNTTNTWDQLIGIDGGGPNYRTLWFGFYSGQTSQFHCSHPYWDGISSSNWWSVDPSFANVGINFEINKWYNFCSTYENSTRICRNYINGILAASGTRPGLGDLNNPNGSTIQLFGCNNVPSQNAQLRIFSMYNRRLTESEIFENYNALRGRFDS